MECDFLALKIYIFDYLMNIKRACIKIRDGRDPHNIIWLTLSIGLLLTSSQTNSHQLTSRRRKTQIVFISLIVSKMFITKPQFLF